MPDDAYFEQNDPAYQEDFEDYILPEVVSMTPEEAVALIEEKFGKEVELSDVYYEADYTMVFPTKAGDEAYYIFKNNREVKCGPYKS